MHRELCMTVGDCCVLGFHRAGSQLLFVQRLVCGPSHLQMGHRSRELCGAVVTRRGSRPTRELCVESDVGT